MCMTFERRKNKRLPIVLYLQINQMFKQNDVVIDNMNAEILVFDISRSGIGFLSEKELPVGYYFKARIGLGEGDYFHAVIHIIRTSKREDGQNVYGAQFVGLAPFLAGKIDEYERRLQGDLTYYY